MRDEAKALTLGVGAALVLAIAFLAGEVASRPKPAPVTVAPVATPKCSPACDCKVKPVAPFNVVCPYCRNAIQVQPSATSGATGAVLKR